MKLTYYDFDKSKNLIEEIFLLTVTEEDIPFTSSILPIGLINIAFIRNNKQLATYNSEKTPLKNAMFSGQFYGSYRLDVLEKGYTVGISLHPSAIYKLFKIDLFQFYNKHTKLKDVNIELYKILNPIFLEHKNNISEFGRSINKKINSLYVLENDKFTYYRQSNRLHLGKRRIN